MISRLIAKSFVSLTLSTGLAVLVAACGGSSTHREAATAPPAWQPPAPSLHGDLSAAPVPGWRTKLIDMFSASASARPRDLAIPSPMEAVPYVGDLAGTGFFIAKETTTPDTQWWLIAVKTRDGQPAFPPVSLNTTSEPPRCFLNVDSVLCLNDYRAPVTAWVVDATSGRVSYQGPTDLRVDGADLTVRQIGVASVATTQGQGVFGVGPRATTSWFVPGDGDIPPNALDEPGATGFLTTQSASDPRSSAKTVFSARDGRVVTPPVAAGAEVDEAVTYPGGFAAEVTTDDGPTEVQFFDEEGQRVGDRGQSGRLSTATLTYPIVEGDNGKWMVFAPDGTRILEADGEVPTGVRVVGDVLFANRTSNASFPEWQQYDWRTGKEGTTCPFDMRSRYRGSDDEVGVFAVDNPQAGILARGRSLSTCDELWSLPARADSSAQIWHIDTALIRSSDDGDELMSLVPRNQ